jgi:hypothetical protein
MDAERNIDEELREMLKDVGEPFDAAARALDDYGPRHYYRDGTPIVGDEHVPGFMKWAMLFEDINYKIVKVNRTLYGERLSTVWLGLDHSFAFGRPHKPIIFETMLFKPEREGERERLFGRLRGEPETEEEKAQREKQNAYDKKHYPHDNLQLRYATEREAEDSHEALWLQCFIPPRWRSFLLGTIGGLEHWKTCSEDED